MNEHHEEEVAIRQPTLLVGDSRRPRELGAVLQALARVRAGRDDAFHQQVLEDLEELLARRKGGGMAILEYERVPVEDIGFVRRFLERNPGWKLIVLGEDAQDLRARGLLSLPHAQWLVWPPDLDQLGALIPDEAPHSAPAAPAEPVGVGGVDVGSLLEELLAGSTLSGDGSPRYRYRCDRSLRVEADPNVLSEGLVGLFCLARQCAGEGNVVSVTADSEEHGGDPRGAVRVRAEFPLGPLTDGDLPGILEVPFDGDPSVAHEVAVAQGAARALETRGATVDLLAHRAGRLRLDIQLPVSVARRRTPEPTLRGEDAFG